MIAVFALAELAKIHKFSYFADMTDNDFWLTFNKFIKRYIEKNNITE
jgi:hypothetical protein